MNKLLAYRFLCVALFLISFIQPLSILYKETETFFSKGYMSSFEALKGVYEGSQYIKKKNPGIIPDQALESFAGGVFLKGINPILIIHDQPPMGRYIISLSILFFDNANTVVVILLFLSGFGVFLVARTILNNTLLSIAPLAIFINEPLFLNKFYNSPLLEPIQLPFIIFALYFFIQGISRENYTKWFCLTSAMIGLVISIRFFILGACLVFAMLMYFLIRKKIDRRLIMFVFFLPIALLILLLSYIRTIQLGASILNIFGIQKYIFNYHKAQLSLPFSFWDLLLFNRWHTWWGTREVIFDPQWIIIWPISAFLTLGHFILGVFKKLLLSEQEKIIIIWIIVYSLFLSMGETSTRYFPPLLPFIYIIAISFLIKITSLVKIKRKLKFI